MSQVGVLLYDSPIHQLTEHVQLEHCQAILELAAKPLPETRLLLLIRVHVYPAYCESVLKFWAYCITLLLPCFRAKNSVNFLLITPAGT